MHDEPDTDALERAEEQRQKARMRDLLHERYEAAAAGQISCGHTVADLIGGTEKGPDGAERPCVTKCGACLLARQGERRPSILAEMIARLTRDADTFADEQENSTDNGPVKAYALKCHSRALARLLSDARDLADAGHHERAVALLRGDMREGGDR